MSKVTTTHLVGLTNERWEELCDRQDRLLDACQSWDLRCVTLARIECPHIYEAARKRFIRELFDGGSSFYFRLDDENYENALRSLAWIEETYRSILLRQYDLEAQVITLDRRFGIDDDLDCRDENGQVWYVQFELRGLSGDGIGVVPYDMFALECEQAGWVSVLKIHRIEGDLIMSRLRLDEIQLYKTYMAYKLTFNLSLIACNIPFIRQHQAIRSLDQNDYLRRGLLDDGYDDLREVQEPRIDFKATTSPELQADLRECNLLQQVAIKSMIENRCRPTPFLLFGPPGTGKTFTLVKAVGQILARDETVTVLVSASSNVCADDLAERLLKNDLVKPDETIRFMSRWRYNQIPDWSRKPYQCCVYPDSGNLRLVVTTNVRSGAIPIQKFDYVIIDEAGHATESEALIPMSRLRGHNCVILAGDHKQLGPVVLSKAGEYGLENSTFKRLVERHFDQDDPMFRVDLRETYRSDPRITKVYSDLFYEGKLVSRGKHTPGELMCLLVERFGAEFNHPLVFLNVDGKHEQFPNSKSRYNQKEAAKCVELLQEFEELIEPSRIGVISPYKLQAIVIQQMYALSKVKRDDSSEADIVEWLKSDRRAVYHPAGYDDESLKISTVDAFQGKERDIIIISTVCSEDRTVSFIENQRRFNVSISRAKQFVIVVGNREALRGGKYWSSYLDYVDKGSGRQIELNDPPL